MKAEIRLTRPALRFALALIFLSTIIHHPLTLFAQGTAFTYQGRLNSSGASASGSYDFQFTLYDSTNQPGTLIAGPITNSAVGVTNGLFITALDFGGNIFTGADRWLDISVRTNGGGAFTTLSPRQKLTPTPYAITAATANGLAGLSVLQNSSGAPDLIGGASLNFVSPGVVGAIIGGGGATNYFGGSYSNGVSGNFGAVNGGVQNTAGYVSFVGGGYDNIAGGNFSTIAGGYNNTVQSNTSYATIGGGTHNIVESNADIAMIAGGHDNTIESAPFAFIGGGGINLIQSNAYDSVIAGGGYGTIGTNAHSSFIGGGGVNTIQSNAIYAAIVGGYNNTIETNASDSAIGGGEGNVVQPGAGDSVIAGGYYNLIQSNAFASSIGGGRGNQIWVGAFDSTIAGGPINWIMNGANASTIGGGYLNVIQGNAGGSIIGGGVNNTILSNASWATVPGGLSNQAGANYSYAAGQQAQALHQGSFVWADSQNTNFPSTTADQFNVRAKGGVRLMTSGAGATLDGQPILSGTVALAQLPAAVVTNNETGLNLSGSFSGNGAGVSNVPLFNLNTAGAISWPGTFVSNSTTAAGTSPIALAAMDVNNDGKLDVICANYNTNYLSVLTNNGKGGLAPWYNLSVGNNPDSLVVADVNGDGKPDLICANLGGTVSVLLNNGNGSFTLASNPSVGSDIGQVVAADLNGDGRLELIAACFLNNTLVVLTNNGSGNFTVQTTLNAGSGCRSVVAADVNGDGKPDLISANYGTNTLTIFTNNGSGAFTLASNLVVNGNPFYVTTADVNGDGKMDLICAFPSTATVGIYTNNGSGGFTVAATPSPGNGVVGQILAWDVNGDGKVDLVCGNNSYPNTVSLLINNGNGTFGAASNLNIGTGAGAILAADLNGDGAPDLVIGNYNDNTVSVALSTPLFTGSFPPNVALLNASQTFTGASTFNNAANSFSGDGSGLTGLNANNISSGTVADARLSANVAFHNTANTFTANNAFNGTSTFNGALNINSGSGFDQSSAGNFFIDAPGNAGGRFAVLANGNVGIGTSNPQGSLHVYSANNPTVVRIQSTGTPGFGSLEFCSNPQSDTNQWRPAYIQSLDAGGFTGGLGFYLNGTGSGNKFGTNEVMRLINGLVGIGTNNPSQKLHVVGNILATGTVTGSSDRNVKENFAPIDPLDVLNHVTALPITRWNYKADANVTHLGPMAQDFYAAFNVGMDDKHISMVDADGVALAAIQGLNEKLQQKLEQKETEITELKQQNEKLGKRLDDLEQMMKSIAARN